MTKSFFENFGTMCIADQLRVEALRAALERFAFDGTEIHIVINAELRGLEHEHAAENIRHAVVTQYSGCVPLDAALELFLILHENGKLE
jgi:hypothetical protein